MKHFVKSVILFILTLEAKAILKKHKPFIIAVSGNIGKTSAKDAIYAVLEDSFDIRKTDKSLNSEFGVPLTILGEKSGWNSPLAWWLILWRGAFIPFDEEYPSHLVIEFGADKPKDIQVLASWINPNIAVLTQFGEVPVHVEFFKDREELVEEEVSIARKLKDDGVFIYSVDDHDSVKVSDSILAIKKTIGIEKGGDISATYVTPYGSGVYEGVRADVLFSDTKEEMVLPEVIGKSSVYAGLFALAVARELHVPTLVALGALREMQKPKGRMRLLKGINGTLIIDDTYNSSPKAVEHGLKTLSHLESKGRKIAVLGDMLELGQFSKEEHYRMGALVKDSAHLLLTVGIRSRGIVEGALDAGMNEMDILTCDSAIEAGKELVKILKDGDTVYIKGSQSMRMEHAVKMILASEHDPQEVLVRQEKEWLLK